MDFPLIESERDYLFQLVGTAGPRSEPLVKDSIIKSFLKSIIQGRLKGVLPP